MTLLVLLENVPWFPLHFSEFTARPLSSRLHQKHILAFPFLMLKTETFTEPFSDFSDSEDYRRSLADRDFGWEPGVAL